mgnify:CR=1 FL=1
MALYEIFIPSNDPDGFNITARIRADSWVQALRNGLQKLGDSADVKNVMVDIKETSIDVTDPKSGRVFRIRELDDEASTPAQPASTAPPASAAPPASTAPPPAAPTGAPPPAAKAPPPAAPAPPKAAPPPPATAPQTPQPAAAPPPAAAPQGAPRPAPAAEGAKPENPAAAPAAAEMHSSAAAAQPEAAAVPAETLGTEQPPAAPREPAFDPAETITRERASEAPTQQIGRGVEAEESIEDIISDLVMETQSLYEHPDLASAANFLLQLSHQAIPSDAGAVFISDINRNDLYFAAATGPKAEQAMQFRVPMGMGLVGFSAQEGVAVAVSDAHKDPRFYAKISKKTGYETRSILCVPVQQEGRVFGALELINKTTGSSFTSNELSILNFLAHEFADYLVNTNQTGG